jgi:hypothetical protein
MLRRRVSAVSKHEAVIIDMIVSRERTTKGPPAGAAFQFDCLDAAPERSLLSKSSRGMDGNSARFALKQRHSDHPSIALPRLSREARA